MNNEFKVPWVRIHLERQTEGSAMPDSIIGRLIKETDDCYVLDKVTEPSPDGESWVERQDIDFIRKTYVWRCEVLGDKRPDFLEEDEDDFFDGGLG